MSQRQLSVTTLTESQPCLLDIKHCALFYLIKRSLVVGLAPKAQPSISVGFELGVFRSGFEFVTHCTYSNFGK